jgi:hypothetical protein
MALRAESQNFARVTEPPLRAHQPPVIHSSVTNNFGRKKKTTDKAEIELTPHC